MYLFRFLVLTLSFITIHVSLQAQQVLMEDVVYLKNGSVVRGKVLEYKPTETIKVEIYGGSVLVYPAADIIEVKKEASKQQPVQQTTTTTITKKPFHNPEKGWYHYTSGSIGGGMDAMGMIAPVIGLSHSSGYFFKRGIGIGIGAGIQRNGAFNMVPVYLDVRGNFMKTPTSIFYSLALGYNAVTPSQGGWNWGEITSSKGGYYIHPAIGVRFPSRNRVHTVLDFGCAIQSAFGVKGVAADWWGGEAPEYSRDIPLMMRPTLRIGVMF